MNRLLLFSGCVFALLLFHRGTAFPQEPGVCTGCHKTQAEGKSVHPVIKTEGCVSCHTKPHAKAAKAMKFLPATGVDLCWRCHNKTAFTRAVQHPPVASGQCTSCHGVHASDFPRLLTAKTPDLCFQCHDKAKFVNKTTHPPVAEGMCTSCHDPHSSAAKKLLLSAPPGLCLNCHDKQKFSAGKGVHAPVAAGRCASCHEPHASAGQKLLLKQAPELCFECHSKDDLVGKKVMHAPVGSGQCPSCHATHRSDSPKLLVAKMPDLCFSCHDKKDFSRKNVHPPVAGTAGTCMSCHAPHSADSRRLLRLRGNNLCLECHPKVATEPHGVTNIGSATGHPLQTQKTVVIAGRKTRLSCLSCHEPHSSDSIRLFVFKAKEPLEICQNCHGSSRPGRF